MNKKITIEQKINITYQVSPKDYLSLLYYTKRMSIVEIATHLECSVGNIRRIARKNELPFKKEKIILMYRENNNNFHSRSMNLDNVLYKKWLN
jgi:hypothetical protein